MLIRKVLVAGLIAAFSFGTTPSFACTGISLKAGDGAAIRGRTLEFGFPMQSKVLVVPAGQELSGTLPDGGKGLVYKSRYAFVGANALGLPAILDGIKAAGKTGTTNAHRDAWFVGYTGNFIAGIWFGNDDYSPMTQMTGGSLPAMTWKEIMVFAHQGVELKTIPGLGPDKPGSGRAVAEGKKEGPSEIATGRPSALTRRGADALVRVERLMDDATRAIAAHGAPSKADAQGAATNRQETFAAASDQQPPGPVRGN